MALVLSNGMLCDVDENGVILGTVCQGFDIARKECDLYTGDVVAYLRIWHGSRSREHKVEGSQLTANGLLKVLLKKGVAIPDDQDTLVSINEYTLDSCTNAPLEYVHRQLGFTEIDGELVYLSANPIGDLSEEELQSQYVDMKALDPKGTFEGWRNVICEEVLGHAPLELALVIGASAPLVYLIREAGMLEELPVVALVGESSSGKSSAMQLMSSIEGSTRIGGKILMNFNATVNAFFKQLEDRNGGAYLFDEITGKRDWDLGKIAYQLVAGVEKAACTANRTLKEQARFAGTVVFTGEHSLLENVKMELGLLARVLTLQSVHWTKSAEHSEALKAKLHANHGTAIVPLIKHLMAAIKNDPDVFANQLREEQKALLELEPTNHGIENRLYFMYALFIMTAKVASQAWNIKLNIKGIRKLLLDAHEKNRPLESQAQKLYCQVIAKINENHTCFPQKEKGRFNSTHFSNRVFGMFDVENNAHIIWITQETFKKFIGDDFGNFQPLLKKLADNGFVKRDAHRHYLFTKTLRFGEAACYGFYVRSWTPKNFIPSNKRRKKKQTTQTTQTKLSTQIVNLLLADDDDEMIKETTRDITEDTGSNTCDTASCEAC